MSSLKRSSISKSLIVEINNEKEEEDSDVRLLRGMGYIQELYRGFSPLMSFVFCFTAVSVLPSISLGFNFTLSTRGSSSAIWSWIVASIIIIFIGLSLAEIFQFIQVLDQFIIGKKYSIHQIY